MILMALSGQSTMIQKQESLKTLDFLQLECYALSSPMHPLTNAQVDTTRTILSCAATNITVQYFFKTLMCFLCMYRKQRSCWIIQVSFSVLCAMPIHILTDSAKDSFFPTSTKIVMFCLSDDSHSKQREVVLKILDIKCTHHTHRWQQWEVKYVNKLDDTILKFLKKLCCV